MNVNLEDLEGYQGIKKFAQAKGAFISLTYACQCQCKHCGVSLFVKKNDVLLSTEEIKERVLDRLKDCGIDVAYFFGGEPTLHKVRWDGSFCLRKRDPMGRGNLCLWRCLALLLYTG